MKSSLLITFLFVLNILYAQKTFKVIVERFENGNPKLIRYFNSSTDTSEIIQVENKIGLRKLNKPLTIVSESYYENGQLEYRGSYVKGFADGLFVFYYENGQQHARSYYKNGEPCDSLICYYLSGKLQRLVIELKKTKKIWHNVDYHENGKKAVDCFQIQLQDKIVLAGKYIEWYETGQKAFESILSNNWTKGKWTKWDINGTFVQSNDPLRVASPGEE